MRQGQQNRRGRGRSNNNNNRKSQNPLMRSFESSGPDVKIRGTPSHIAEKYVTLARDALSSGDPVLAENYLQHAEHYNRIILGYREQLAQQGGESMSGGAARTHTLAGPGDPDDDVGDEDNDEFGLQQQGGTGEQQQQPYQQQPRNYDNQNRYENRQPRHDQRERFNNNHNHNNNGNRQDRNDGQRFDRGDRNASGGDNRYREDRRPQGSGGEGQPGEGGFRRRERYQGNSPDRELANGGNGRVVEAGSPPPQPPVERVATPQPAPKPSSIEQEQPAFLRRPVRRRKVEPAAPAAEAATPPPAASDDE